MTRRPHAAAAALSLLLAGCGPGPDAPIELIVIPPGASLGAVADSLAAHGVIGSKKWFRVVARVGGYDRSIRSGHYELTRDQGARSALKMLTGGRALLTRVTIPEGYTLPEIADVVEKNLGIPQEEFLRAAKSPALRDSLGVPGESFEGFLRPETYFFAPGTSAATVIHAMADAARADWDSSWAGLAAGLGFDRKTAVTLASLVEGEARVPGDRPLIAAVYRNRLRLHMPLQADPTVQYAILLATGARKSRLFEKDYDFVSPYNTYLHPGLPPSPVGTPGRESLQAVLTAPESPFLYFVAGPEGAHIFSRSYAEHLRAVRRVHRGR